MLDLTEHITLRITRDECNKIKKFATENTLSQSAAIRLLINESLPNDQKKLEQKMLVEILMILRSKLNEADVNHILSMSDAFKQQEGIK